MLSRSANCTVTSRQENQSNQASHLPEQGKKNLTGSATSLSHRHMFPQLSARNNVHKNKRKKAMMLHPRLKLYSWRTTSLRALRSFGAIVIVSKIGHSYWAPWDNRSQNLATTTEANKVTWKTVCNLGMISASDYKMQPTDNDVLSGRGAWYNNHPGNKRFRKMLDDQKVSQPYSCYHDWRFVSLLIT